MTFTETLIETGDCSTDGIVATIELRWTATNVCGNFSELVVIANIVDESSPVFVNFIPEMTIGCNDSLPALIVTDNCGVVSTTTLDSIIPGDCIFEYDMLRIVTATDQCGNTTTLLQTIHVGNGSGPVIDGVVEVICDDISIPEVTAYDSCAGAFVLVAMQEDTLDVPCDGLVIERTWTAVDFCGNVSVVHQTIILNDQTPPEIIVPTYSIINQFLGISYNLIFSWQTDLLFKLSVLDGSSVFIADDCDQGIVPVFTVDTSYADNCIEDGYFERRTYTWTATDACGNSTSISFTVDIKDETPPVFSVVPTDVTIVCAPLPPVPPVFTEDAAQPVTIVFSETTEPGDEPGVFIVTRKWTATDACGNITEYVQRITWIPDTFLECNIILPDVVECNTHGVMISSSYTGGIGPVTYEWEIVGENCFIQGGQGTPKINIYVGWSDAKIILTVTDAFGCVSMCMTTLSCLFSLDNSLPPGTNAVTDSNTDLPTPPAVVRHTSKDNLQQLHLWPNPANQSVNLGFESSAEGEVEFSFMNFLGQVVLNDKISAQEGFNTHKIDVEQIREGSYLMQVKTENETHTKVIVIMRNN